VNSARSSGRLAANVSSAETSMGMWRLQIREEGVIVDKDIQGSSQVAQPADRLTDPNRSAGPMPIPY
jgi:hypothetical protein